MSLEKEKSVVATIEKVRNYLPDDLVFSFFLKLPMKSLKRFGCVRKSWALFFENPNFMATYCNNFISKNHSFYDNASLILQHATEGLNTSCSTLYLLSGEKFESRVKLDFTIPCEDFYGYTIILGSGSINGIFCLSSVYSNKRIVVLWNPATKESKIIPPNSSDSIPYRTYGENLHGFGYDHVKDDYKVVRHVIRIQLTSDEIENHGVPSIDVPFNPLWEIYSLRSNSWRTLDIDMSMASYRSVICDRVYMDGMCHWLGGREIHSKEVYLVSFDLSNEVFFTTPMASYMDDNSDMGFLNRDLVVLNGSIALITNYEEVTTFYISILGEVGVKESWTKLFIVGPLPYVGHPIGVGKKGDIFFIKKDGELVWFDLCTGMIEELGVKGKTSCCQIVIYKESRIPVGGINK